jgi:hypothetical protein
MSTKKPKTKSELSKTDVKIVVIVLIFIAAVILSIVEFAFLYKPKTEEIKDTQTTLDSLQVKVEEAKRVPEQITYFQQEIDRLEGKTSEDGTEDAELRQEINVPVILSIVENAANNAKMKLTSIAMDGNAAYVKGGVIEGIVQEQEQGAEGEEGSENEATPEVDASAFYKLGIAMSVDSVTYEGLMKFLENVEDAGYYITTSSAALNTKENVQGVVYEGTINFYIYSFVASN